MLKEFRSSAANLAPVLKQDLLVPCLASVIRKSHNASPCCCQENDRKLRVLLMSPLRMVWMGFIRPNVNAVVPRMVERHDTHTACLMKQACMQAVMAGGSTGDPVVNADPPKIRVVVRTRPMSAKVQNRSFLRPGSTKCMVV